MKNPIEVNYKFEDHNMLTNILVIIVCLPLLLVSVVCVILLVPLLFFTVFLVLLVVFLTDWISPRRK